MKYIKIFVDFGFNNLINKKYMLMQWNKNYNFICLISLNEKIMFKNVNMILYIFESTKKNTFKIINLLEILLANKQDKKGK